MQLSLSLQPQKVNQPDTCTPFCLSLFKHFFAQENELRPQLLINSSNFWSRADYEPPVAIKNHKGNPLSRPRCAKTNCTEERKKQHWNQTSLEGVLFNNVIIKKDWKMFSSIQVVRIKKGAHSGVDVCGWSGEWKIIPEVGKEIGERCLAKKMRSGEESTKRDILSWLPQLNPNLGLLDRRRYLISELSFLHPWLAFGRLLLRSHRETTLSHHIHRTSTNT